MTKKHHYEFKKTKKPLTVYFYLTIVSCMLEFSQQVYMNKAGTLDPWDLKKKDDQCEDESSKIVYRGFTIV